MNKSIFLGNVGQSPTVSATTSGEQVVIFTIGVRKNKSETTWIKVTAMGKTSDIVKQYVQKGDQILIEGSVSVRSYLSRENEPKAILQCFASSVHLLNNKRNDSSHSETQSETFELPSLSVAGELIGDYIPF